MEERNSVQDMNDISDAWDLAKEHGLQYEVICWAMYYLQSNPNATIAEALNVGLEEWDV